MENCRTCQHNTYSDIKDCDFVSCSHPITIRKTPRPEAGDPIWVNALTADMKISAMPSYSMDSCPTWERASPAPREIDQAIGKAS